MGGGDFALRPRRLLQKVVARRAGVGLDRLSRPLRPLRRVDALDGEGDSVLPAKRADKVLVPLRLLSAQLVVDVAGGDCNLQLLPQLPE